MSIISEATAITNGTADSTLLRLISAGEADALHTLQERYATWLYRLAHRYTRDRTTAEEVVQDVLLAVWQSSARFNPARTVRAWLFGILRHHAIDAQRSRLYQARIREQSLNHWSPTDQAFVFDGPEATLDQHLLKQVFHTLPPSQRETFHLMLAGWSVAAIAQHTGQPLGTVKTQRLRSIQHARALLAH